VNDTKVFPARLLGKKQDTGASIEVFLLNQQNEATWEALTRPSKRIRPGIRVSFAEGILTGTIQEKGADGKATVRLEAALPLDAAIDRAGVTPLPPYIRRAPCPGDRERYQTVYAAKRGAVAAPTAGFHFTRELLDRLEDRGIRTVAVTLHVGIGTFRPLKPEDFARDTLHAEYCIVSREAAEAVHTCRDRGGRIVAVGTTTARALESASRSGTLEPFEGWTDLFIRESYQFRAVDTLVTNFHLPRSSLLVMVSAFGGRERVLAAYREAVREGYRFYSYGDAMLLGAKR
jgi:S-adenosylmethionine:tRNA ribosyltransferase-isomerase